MKRLRVAFLAPMLFFPPFFFLRKKKKSSKYLRALSPIYICVLLTAVSLLWWKDMRHQSRWQLARLWGQQAVPAGRLLPVASSGAAPPRPLACRSQSPAAAAVRGGSPGSGAALLPRRIRCWLPAAPFGSPSAGLFTTELGFRQKAPGAPSATRGSAATAPRYHFVKERPDSCPRRRHHPGAALRPAPLSSGTELGDRPGMAPQQPRGLRAPQAKPPPPAGAFPRAGGTGPGAGQSGARGGGRRGEAGGPRPCPAPGWPRPSPGTATFAPRAGPGVSSPFRSAPSLRRKPGLARGLLKFSPSLKKKKPNKPTNK